MNLDHHHHKQINLIYEDKKLNEKDVESLDKLKKMSSMNILNER